MKNEVYARGVEVAGTHFRYKDALRFLNETDDLKELNFILEPTNKYDPNAIKVMWGHRHIGYIPAPLAKRIYMDNVEDRIISQYQDGYLDESQNNKIRLVFDIVLANTTKSGEEVLEERDRGRDGA